MNKQTQLGSERASSRSVTTEINRNPSASVAGRFSKLVCRVGLCGDFHCGANTGLTPPAWQIKYVPGGAAQKRNKYAKLQKASWDEFKKSLRIMGKPDILIVNGDSIDGSGFRSGGVEQITTDPLVQVDMATEVIRNFGAKEIVVIAGTPYHVGQDTDYEEVIADRVGAAKFGSHEWVRPKGSSVIIDCKHDISGSSSPFTSGTPLLRESVFNSLWASRGEQPGATLLVRSHVHRYTYTKTSDFAAMTLPALQAYGTKFGARKCSNLVDWGWVMLDVYKDSFKVNEYIVRIPEYSPKVLEL